MPQETQMSIPLHKEKKPSTAAQITFDAEIPEATEKVSKKGWVKYGDNNLYPQWLFTLKKDSPIHGGIIGQKVQFISGNGVEVVGAMASQNEEIQKNGTSKYTLNEVIESVAEDNEVTSYFYLLFQRNNVGEGWNVSPLSAELMRPSEDLQTFYYSENWSTEKQNDKTNFKSYKSIVNVVKEPIGVEGQEGYLAADTECVMYVKKEAKQTILEDGKTLTTSTFPTPRYSGAIPSIMADVEMNFFHYAEVVNGWTSNTIVNMNNGVPEDEKEKEEIVESIGRQTGNKKKSGGVTVHFNDGVEKATTVETIGSNNNDSRYLLTQEAISDTTMIAHRVQTPELFGVLVSGKLGGTADLPLSFERFQHTYSEPERQFIITPIELGLSTLNDWNGFDLEFVEYSPPLERQIGGDNPVADAINSMSPLVATKFLEQLTSAEVRALGGLPALKEGEVTIGAIPLPTNEVQAQQMADELESSVLAKFGTIGEDAKRFNVMSSRAFDLSSSDADYVAEFTAEKFAIELSVDQQRILQMIAKGESFKAVVDATGLSASQVGRQVINLTTEGLVAQGESGEPWSLTEEGNSAVATEELIDVRYTYELRPDAPALVEGGESRSFCKTLIGLNRAYTREEIDTLSASIGRNVWLFRGGWYHDPKADRNQPSCRHFWKQNIILR